MKNRKALLFIFLLLLSLFLFGESVSSSISRQKEESYYRELNLFTDVLSLIRKNYVREVDPKELIHGALKGMLSSLDPYSAFLEPDFYKELLIETEGKFGGLGMVISEKDRFLTVISPIEDTPAFRAGIKSGDRIIKIDEKLTKSLSVLEAAKLLRGEPGTKVKLEIMREGESELLKFSLVRAVIKVKSVKKGEVIPGTKIGYIRLIEFQKNTAKDLENVLQKLKKEEIESLILDLRNNPGGLLDSAVEVADSFLPADKLVTYTEGRSEEKHNYKTKKPSLIPEKISMVILVNGGTASASEIVVGALSAYKRAIILGEKTFGKGSVQNLVPLSDGSAVKLTIAHYYTPKGICIAKKGITPDIVVPFPKKETLEYSLQNPDPQLQRAIDLLKGLNVLKKP